MAIQSTSFTDTGVRFRGETKEKLDSQSSNSLNYNADSGSDFVNIYGTWMSRDKTWIAPKDTQQEIIIK